VCGNQNFSPSFFTVGSTSSREQDLLIPMLDQQISRLIDCAMKPLVGQRLIIYKLFGLLASRDFGIRVLQVSRFMLHCGSLAHL
jgi:hypothetical protein